MSGLSFELEGVLPSGGCHEDILPVDPKADLVGVHFFWGGSEHRTPTGVSRQPDRKGGAYLRAISMGEVKWITSIRTLMIVSADKSLITLDDGFDRRFLLIDTSDSTLGDAEFQSVKYFS
jgi:hypothetical protein